MEIKMFIVIIPGSDLWAFMGIFTFKINGKNWRTILRETAKTHI